MPGTTSNTELRAENRDLEEEPARPGAFALSESGAIDTNGQDVAFTLVDDPKNESVYNGPGSYAATRAESAVRLVEEALPPLRFELHFEKDLSALHVQARVPPSVRNEAFIAVLSKALGSTATRLAPTVGELRTKSSLTPDPRV